ncbi:MAG: YbhB/YbcL family Raf kinase inhibitor-like protein [Candidatus Eremiobacteraeota bacterium]|nr:YbhB/YbcL family Raf kinase inhibitor-like protein [Candidatus Eremiobacteraeota bacterium]
MTRWFGWLRFPGWLVGRKLQQQRAGPEFRVAEDIRFAYVPRTIELRSDAFRDGEPLSAAESSPPLEWRNVPGETKKLALVMEDVDVPFPRPLVHAIAYDVDPSATAIAAGALDGTQVTMGYNGSGHRGYVVPAPLPGQGAHRYYVTLLAIDFAPSFDQPPTRASLLDAIAGHVLALGETHFTAER